MVDCTIFIYDLNYIITFKVYDKYNTIFSTNKVILFFVTLKKIRAVETMDMSDDSKEKKDAKNEGIGAERL